MNLIEAVVIGVIVGLGASVPTAILLVTLLRRQHSRKENTNG